MMLHKSADGRQVFVSNNTVMGYTDNRSRLSKDELPPALLSWMEWSGTTETLTTSEDHVDPLLWTQWAQKAPYNSLCPEYEPGEKSATGCVAAAMAQVMAYWRYPADAFDWDNMLPNYNTLDGLSATAEQIDAVAELMLACGTSVNMNYGKSSNSNTYIVPVALAGLYGYNPGARYVQRRNMSYAEWAELLRNELRNGRPVLYRGASSSAGHSFVVDGFREDGFFHVNWGWEGKSDGWYRFTMLTPPNLGTGGGNSSDGYNNSQGMVICLAPSSVLNSPLQHNLVADSLTLYHNANGLDSANICGYANYSATDTLEGDLGLALYQNNVLLRVVKYVSFSRFADGRWSRKLYDISIDSLTPGETYQLIAVWRDPIHSPDWKMVEGINHAPCGRDLVATSANTYTHSRISNQGHPMCNHLAYNVLATGHTASLTSVWTTDSSEWTGEVTFLLDSDTHYQFFAYSGMDLASDRQDTLSLTTMPITVPSGFYMLWTGYMDGSSVVWLDNPLPVQVEDRPATDKIYPLSGSFVLSDTIFSKANPVLKMDVLVALGSTVPADNYFSGQINIGIYNENDERVLAPATALQVMCGKNDTLALHFEGDVGNYLPDGRYAVKVRRCATGKSTYTVLSNSGYVNYITVDQRYSDATLVETEKNTCKVLKNNRIYIVRDGRTYDVMGRRVD